MKTLQRHFPGLLAARVAGSLSQVRQVQRVHQQVQRQPSDPNVLFFFDANMASTQSPPGQSPTRPLSSHPSTAADAGAPPPPSSSSFAAKSSQAAPALLQQASSRTAQPSGPIPSARTAQIARHLSRPNSKKKTSSHPPPAAMASRYSIRKVGAPFTLEHRVYIEKDGQPISAFHDIPLYANAEQTILNMVVEIPRWTNAKQEVGRQTDAPPQYPSPLLTAADRARRSPRTSS